MRAIPCSPVPSFRKPRMVGLPAVITKSFFIFLYIIVMYLQHSCSVDTVLYGTVDECLVATYLADDDVVLLLQLIVLVEQT